MRLFLASSSPRRIAFCRSLGLYFETVSPDVDETLPAGIDPAMAVRQLAVAKAAAVRSRFPDATIIAADTDVSFGGEILGKPADADDARRMLTVLSGRDHMVFTGLTVQRADGLVIDEVVETRVRFRALSAEDINRYVATGDPLDKAGAYGIQVPGAGLIAEIDGCFTSVAGLPICRLSEILAGFGLLDQPVICGTGIDMPPASITQRSTLR